MFIFLRDCLVKTVPRFTHKHLRPAHTGTHLFTHIFGITRCPVTGLWGWQTLSYCHLTAELLFQRHPPSRHNTPSTISSHLFSPLCFSMGLYGPLSSHKTQLCPPQLLSWRVNLCCFFFRFLLAEQLFHVWIFPLESTDFREAKQALMWAGVTSCLLFCILCNSTCQLGENRWKKNLQMQ